MRKSIFRGAYFSLCQKNGEAESSLRIRDPCVDEFLEFSLLFSEFSLQKGCCNGGVRQYSAYSVAADVAADKPIGNRSIDVDVAIIEKS